MEIHIFRSDECICWSLSPGCPQKGKKPAPHNRQMQAEKMNSEMPPTPENILTAPPPSFGAPLTLQELVPRTEWNFPLQAQPLLTGIQSRLIGTPSRLRKALKEGSIQVQEGCVRVCTRRLLCRRQQWARLWGRGEGTGGSELKVARPNRAGTRRSGWDAPCPFLSILNAHKSEGGRNPTHPFTSRHTFISSMAGLHHNRAGC